MGTKLTPPQLALLKVLPEGPSDGKFVIGPRLNVAFNLVRRGLARTVGLGQERGGTFVITEAGKEALR